MNSSLICVILAGGKGERFWPLSRRERPKQFLSLDGSGQSLLQATAARLLPLAGSWDNIWVVTSNHLSQGVQEHLPQLPLLNLLLEPEGRDTAPALAWTALEIRKRYGEDTVVGFFPSDPWIPDQLAFQNTIWSATQLAESLPEAIVTLGVKPTYPATGYGYIEQGEHIGTFNNLPAYHVKRFTEKPDRQTAEAFLATGQFSWNSGMFIFRTSVILKELAIYAPEILLPLEQKGVDAYPHLPKKSIDYALMEKTQLAYVLPVDFSWDDLGDWNALERLRKDENKTNVELAHHVGLDTTGAILYATAEEEVIVTIGLDDVLVVRDRNVTLIAKKDRTQEIKKVLKLMQNDPRLADLL